MVHYIDKDALVAEIDERIKKYTLLQQKPEMSDLQEELQNKIDCLNSLKGYIFNTLEVKENDSLTSEVIKKICTIYENLKQERECATVLYNSDETFFNHVLMEYKSIAQKGE